VVHFPDMPRSIVHFRQFLYEAIRGPTTLEQIQRRCQYYYGNGKADARTRNLVAMRVRFNLKALETSGKVKRLGRSGRFKKSDVWKRVG